MEDKWAAWLPNEEKREETLSILEDVTQEPMPEKQPHKAFDWAIRGSSTLKPSNEDNIDRELEPEKLEPEIEEPITVGMFKKDKKKKKGLRHT